ncbi:MAG: hypothetical protein U1D41_04355, partial [Nitrosomonas sp.]|nr:hypothetical protein [Nitrosomonas sp.]MDZ4105388.1 hypothetical protein [Nitrosomonas sp.]
IYVSYKDIFLAEPLRFNNDPSEPDNQKTNWADADESSTKENETKAESNNTENKTLKLSETVPCAQCNLSVPRNEAIEDQEQFFCSEEHRQQYQAANKPGK